MKTSQAIAFTLLSGLVSISAQAQTAVDHSRHSAAAPTGAVTTQAASASAEQQLSAMDKHLQHMRDMSSKMAAAKTDAERQALMSEHKKAMHDSMKMMGGSSASAASPEAAGGHGSHAGHSGSSGQAGGMGHHMMQRHAVMEKRMEMMQTTMQMMMDHMHGPATK